MIDNILLAPYYMALKFRHFLYDRGIKKSRKAEVPTISVGNVTVGGTGKTPHTEMLLRLLASEPLQSFPAATKGRRKDSSRSALTALQAHTGTNLCRSSGNFRRMSLPWTRTE